MTIEDKIYRKYKIHKISLEEYSNKEKLECLYLAISDSRYYGHLTQAEFLAYIKKFYYDDQFNNIYFKWVNNKDDCWLKPSLDHIIPRKNGGDNSLNNIQFLNWASNKFKSDLSVEDWNKIKSNINFYLEC